MVGKLRGVTYKWISNEQEDIGVIAQEVEEVIPEVIKGDSVSKGTMFLFTVIWALPNANSASLPVIFLDLRSIKKQ